MPVLSQRGVLRAVILAVLAGTPSFAPALLKAQAQGAVSDTTRVLPASFVGADIEALLAAARQPARGEYETTAAYVARVGGGPGEPLRLTALPAAGQRCAPATSYDADAGIFTVTLPNVSGVVGVACDSTGRLRGVSAQDSALDAIARIPLAPDSAERARGELTLWLAFRRAPTAQRGSVWRPSPDDTAAAPTAGLVSADVGLWATDRAGRVAFRTVFAPLRYGLAGGLAPQERAAELRQQVANGSPPSPPALTLSAACARNGRVAAVAAIIADWQIYDLWAQLQGLQANGEEQSTTWEQYLARAVARQCDPSTPSGTYTFKLPPDTISAVGRGAMGVWSRGDRESMRYTFAAPLGYQVCQVRHTLIRRGRNPLDAVVSIKPDSFVVGDAEPARFRAVRFYFMADG